MAIKLYVLQIKDPVIFERIKYVYTVEHQNPLHVYFVNADIHKLKRLDTHRECHSILSINRKQQFSKYQNVSKYHLFICT